MSRSQILGKITQEVQASSSADLEQHYFDEGCLVSLDEPLP